MSRYAWPMTRVCGERCSGHCCSLASMSASTGVLEWVTEQDATTQRPEKIGWHLEAFQILLLAHLTVQAWAWVIVPVPYPYTFPDWAILLAAVLMAGFFVLGATGRPRLACALAIPIVAWEVVWLFPGTPNHVFLTLVFLTLSCAFDLKKNSESLLLLQTLRWIAVIIFVWAGIQKALHGLYFQGEFLTWMVAQGIDRWAEIFGWIMSSTELERITALPRFVPGTGPYRVDSWLFVFVSNCVWVGEILLGLAMLHRRTREWAAVGAIALVFTIQTAPREFMFALLYTSLLLLLFRGEPNRRLMPVFLVVYACMLAALLGAPFSFLVKAGGGL
jgi:hypothetical protein